MGEAENKAMKTAPKAKPSGVKTAKTTRDNEKESGRFLRYRSRPGTKAKFSATTKFGTIPTARTARTASGISSALAAAHGWSARVVGSPRQDGMVPIMRSATLSRGGARRD
jgi:hypothetical protein